MKEFHVGKMKSFFGRIVRAFGVNTTSIESRGAQDENISPHNPSALMLSSAHSWGVARSSIAELEFSKSQALVEKQRGSFSK